MLNYNPIIAKQSMLEHRSWLVLQALTKNKIIGNSDLDKLGE
jgi:hypothetical protein